MLADTVIAGGAWIAYPVAGAVMTFGLNVRIVMVGRPRSDRDCPIMAPLAFAASGHCPTLLLLSGKLTLLRAQVVITTSGASGNAQ